MSLRTLLRFAPLLLLLAAGCGNIEEFPLKDCATPGDLGCACRAQGTCNTVASGTPLACVQGTCVQATCTADGVQAAGCLCGGKTACGSGLLCHNGRCEPDTGQTLSAPANPRCYTPCHGGLTTASGYQACGDDGLMEGCIGGALCRQGTCVLPVAAAAGTRTAQGAAETQAAQVDALEASGACTTDAQCPDFQACIGGRCYSDCSQDSDCRGGRQCYRHACRVPCESGTEDQCVGGTSCLTLDGTAGFCLPVAPSAAAQQPPAAGSFSLSRSSLDLSSTHPGGTFAIVNASPTLQRFTVRKLKHREFNAKGPVSVTTNPLHWVQLARAGQAPSAAAELVVEVAAGDSAEVAISGTDNPLLARWDGELEVQSEGLGAQRLLLRFARSPEGQWAGSMYFLANFPEGGLQAWLADKGNRDALRGVGNAFIRRWGALRDQRISLAEFKAALTAMQSESWKWDSVKKRCPSEAAPDSNVGCYLYDNNVGLSIFSDYLPDTPIPTGLSEFPIGLNLRATPGSGDAQAWSGKILSSQALHYAGDPAVKLHFQSDPNTCSTSVGDTCLTFVDNFAAQILVGGRYLTDAGDTTCRYAAPGTYQHTRLPWLVPGFEAGTSQDPVTGARYRYECRDKLLPFGEAKAALNVSLAGSNPIPDGASRKRRLELVDGALIDQHTLFIVFRETLPSFLNPQDPEGFSSYGYMVLTRVKTDLQEEDFQGSAPVDFRAPAQLPGPGCSAELVSRVLAPVGGGGLKASSASAMGIGVVRGIVPTGTAPTPLDASSTEKVHYFCADTGLFDGGRGDDGSASATRVECPPGSRVDYFTLQGAQAAPAAMAALSCQQGGGICRDGEPCARSGACTVGQACPSKGTCGELLQQWEASGANSLRRDPAWRCSAPDAVLCEENRGDLRQGKTFFGAQVQEAVFRPLDSEVADAFRYKTRFRNRSGTSVGFAPQTCVAGSDAVPYCYDPAAIENIRERVDCATHVYTRYYDDLNEEARATLKDFLVRNYAYSEQPVFGQPTPLVIDGFERLNAELLIMLGDESFTAAFASRFDLAGQKLASFEGGAFEPNGINLSGGAGFEMYSLYQASQSYQMVLDRFYRNSPVLWASLAKLPPGQGFITQATTVSYFDRLIRASSQKARVWSEISKRYQSFNRPDLARLAIERAYPQAYLEAIVLSQMMQRVSRSADAADVAQIVRAVELAQHTYRAALLDMRTLYDDISGDVTFYGIPPDYIPFPALDPLDTNAFEKALARARQLASVAVDKEQRALVDNRSFDTDSALFQAELSRIRNDAEDQLAEICGTFRVSDGGEESIYPAIPKYAYLDPRASLMGDPCGLMGNGALYDSIAQLEVARLDFEAVKLSHRNLLEEIQDAQAQVDQQCGRINSFADYRLRKDQEILGFQTTINTLQLVIDATQNALEMAGNLAGLTKCTVGVATDCPTAAVSLAAYTTAGIAGNVVMGALGVVNVGLEGGIMNAESAIAEREIREECDAMRIDGAFAVKALMRRALEIQLESVKVQYNVKIAMSNVLKLRNDATSTMAQQSENEQLAINVEAARNDPNVRIYRNDAIYAADRTFYAALREAYRATKVFEYYTSQSYAARDKLFIVRMVANGDVTLESYLDDLERAFVDFEEQYGNPDTRVAILSLRDDILRIPHLGKDGTALSEAARTQLLRERLKDTSLLDARGYLTLPFSTSVDALSPLTHNHKVRFVEAEVVGTNVGDSLGRLYVRQRGTGVVRGVNDQQNFYAFPQRTAVLNPYFNGVRPLAPEVYRSERLRDRPFANTGWELVVNQKDESVNADIDLASLSDVRLYLYYTDFTEL